MKNLSLFLFISIFFLSFTTVAESGPSLISKDQTGVIIPGGDTTGNGAGPDGKKMIAIESRYSSILEQCLNSQYCELTKMEKQVLQDYLSQIQGETLIEFISSQSHPELIVSGNIEKLYLTGEWVGSPNLINSRLLSVSNDHEAFILLTSLYANHFSKSVQQALQSMLPKLLTWLDRVGVSYSMSFWSQFHIQFFSPSQKQDSLILTDGQFEKQFTSSDFFSNNQHCEIRFTAVRWTTVNKGHALATAHYSRRCQNQSMELGQILYRVDFADGVDWLQFEANSQKVTLRIKKVTWQKSVF